jgi:hypothetical protein
MKTYNTLFTLCMFFLLGGCANIDARYSYDTHADFTALKTYNWLPDVQKSFSKPEYADYYVKLVNELLTSKGFTLSTDNPNFLIRTPQSSRYVERYLTMSGPLDMHEGKIMIEFLYSSSKDLIWQGVAKVTYSPEQVNKSIDSATRELFKEFPPSEKRP